MWKLYFTCIYYRYKINTWLLNVYMHINTCAHYCSICCLKSGLSTKSECCWISAFEYVDFMSSWTLVNIKSYHAVINYRHAPTSWMINQIIVYHWIELRSCYQMPNVSEHRHSLLCWYTLFFSFAFCKIPRHFVKFTYLLSSYKFYLCASKTS